MANARACLCSVDGPITGSRTLAVYTHRSTVIGMSPFRCSSTQFDPLCHLFQSQAMRSLNRKFSSLTPESTILIIPPVKWCLDNSISSQVNMPVSPQDLSSALISALESNAVSPVAAPAGVRFDILLAEDNVVNQKLAVQILNKYGHQVEIAENGALAVDAFKQRIAEGHPFDIILVSGFE